MAQVIRLKESDLIKIVKNVIKEQNLFAGLVGNSQKAVKSKFDGCRTMTVTPNRNHQGTAKIIYDAIQGLGTEEMNIYTALNRLTTMNDVCAVAKLYEQTYGTTLYDDLNGDIHSEDEWSKISMILQNKTFAKPNPNVSRKSSPATRPTKTGIEAFKNFPCVTRHPDSMEIRLKDGTPVIQINGVFYYTNGRKKTQDNSITNFTCEDPEFIKQQTKTLPTVTVGPNVNPTKSPNPQPTPQKRK